VPGACRAGESEVELAELFAWLAAQYPPEEDPKPEGPHGVGMRGAVGAWRDSVVRNLAGHGTVRACEVLGRLCQELPAHSLLELLLFAAQDLARRKTWSPPRPSELLAITQNTGLRLAQKWGSVAGGVHRVFAKAPREARWQNALPKFLWNEVGKGQWSPKDEAALSDYAKGHLDDLARRGVLANREVEL